MEDHEKLLLLVKAAAELTSQEAPKWENIAARLKILEFESVVKNNLEEYQIRNFYEKIVFLSQQNLYGDYILKNYAEDEFIYSHPGSGRNETACFIIPVWSFCSAGM